MAVSWYCLWYEMQKLVAIQERTVAPQTTSGNPFVNRTIVVTGKFEPYTREQVHALIESIDAKQGCSASSKTYYLVCRDKSRQQT